MAFSNIMNSFLLLCSIFLSTTSALNPSSKTTSLDLHLSSVKSICNSTPYPDLCFDSLKLSVSININPNIISYILQSLQTSLSEAGRLTDLFSSVQNSNLIEKQKGTIQDCKELHQITVSSLKKSMSRLSPSVNSRKSADAKAYLSAALTNKNTCLEGLDTASGSLKSVVVNSIINTYKHVSNSLSMLVSNSGGVQKHEQNDKRNSFGGILISGDEYDPSGVITVSKDGTGNFTTVVDAINFAPNNSVSDRIIIHVKAGIYDENVEIPSNKPNIVLLGDGADSTVITGNRNVMDGWTTFRSATVAVSGEGFLARDITFENTAGPEKHQAVALRINADFAAVYRCTMIGYQDTLYVHSFRQFYRECEIYGTIDYIFGNAAVVFQGCNIVSRMPLHDQFIVITAQSRDSSDEATGMSIQNCSILATEDLYSNSATVKSYLGRPWRVYARTVYIESYIDDFINPKGWIEWPGNEGLDTLYYGEYENSGPGSGTENRVTWPSYHVMTYDDVHNFTSSEFITGEEWLDSITFPYD